MKTTVNLFHESLKPQKEKLPLSTVLLINGSVFMVMLLAMLMLQFFEKNKASESAQQRANVESVKNDIALLSKALDEKRDIKQLQTELESVNTKIRNRELLVAYLEEGELSFDATEFGMVMDDLARYHDVNLWLTQITIDTQSVRLQGETLEPASIPMWLKGLQQSPFFNGKSFSTVTFEEIDDREDVKAFVISSNFEGKRNE